MVARDLEQCVDRGNQDKLRRLVKERGADRRVRKRIDRDRAAGALTAEGWEARVAGTPHGGPWSPL
jgi:retron-type reverse transcriptase